MPSRPLPCDNGKLGDARNWLTRNDTPHLAELDNETQDERPLFDGDSLVDLRPDTGALQAGDLLEVTSDSSRIQLLAVCLGHFNGCDHYYTNTGRWFTSHNVRTLFTVSGFVDPSELQQVVAALPSPDASAAVLNVLQDLKMGPSRDVGADLLRKMHNFEAETVAIHQANAGRLDNAYKSMGSAGGYKTLVELADALLPGTPKMNGNFPPAALYAVHKALMADDVGFRPFGQVGRQQSYLFEISPTKEVATTQAVEELVREFYEQPLVGPGRTRNLDSAIGRFILKARIAIDHSRRARQWSPHGMLGPSGGAQLPPLDQDWTATDTQILDFLHLWASYQKFANSSSRHWIGRPSYGPSRDMKRPNS